MSALDELRPQARLPLLGATGLVLVGATVWAATTTAPPLLVDVGLVALAAGLAAAWREAFRRFRSPPPLPSHERLRAVRLAARPDHGSTAWNDRMAALDPSFSAPVLDRALRTLAGDGPWGPPVVESVAFPEGEVVLTAVVPGRPDSVRLTVSRPIGVPLSRPESVEHGWRAGVRSVVPGTAPVALPPADPGMAAARRALLLRDPSFDVDDFSAYLRELRAEVAAGRTDRLDPAGRACLEVYGTPPRARDDAQVRWLEVELDGFFERIEVEHDGWWTSLARRVGDPSAPWKVWRWVPVGGGR